MSRKFLKKIQYLNQNKLNHKHSDQSKPISEANSRNLSTHLEANLELMRAPFHGTSDLMIREFNIGSQPQAKAFILMISGLVNEESININLMKPLLFFNHDLDINKDSIFKHIKESALSVANIRESPTVEETIKAVLGGDTALFVDGSDQAIIVSLRGWEARGVSEPQTEAVVRGPREGFVESIGTNTSLIRRKIKNTNLVFEQMLIGGQTNTSVRIAYIKGIANEKTVGEVKTRLAGIKTDSILESGYIESFIEDAPYSIFPTVGYSEKPDIISAKLLEGRIAIFVDGTPFVLTVPYLFIEAFQSSEDYYSRPFYATFIRWLRWLGFFIATFLPGLYVAITTYHQELLPPALLTSITAAQEGTPFPMVVEALIMVTMFEILREAGVRLPKPVGQAVSIVGALVIGEASVSAGLVGAPMVVLIAATAISSFIVPALSEVSALSRFIFIIVGGFSGLYGIMLAFAIFITHQCSLRSFGSPYFSPLAPTTFSDLKDVVIRAPWWAMKTRPRVIGENRVRQGHDLKPSPPKDDQGDESRQ